MEQLVARRAHNPKVIGSSPIPATTKDLVIDWVFFVSESSAVTCKLNKSEVRC